jgi:hypothetical protein
MKRIETLLTVAGLGLFAFVVSKIGWSTVVYELRTVWIALPVLVALSVVRLLLQTQSWGLAPVQGDVSATRQTTTGKAQRRNQSTFTQPVQIGPSARK